MFIEVGLTQRNLGTEVSIDLECLPLLLSVVDPTQRALPPFSI